MVSERTVVDGRFELLEPLGSGGMGTVWRAYDVALHREVALKEVRPADTDSPGGAPGVQRERVLREARALARITHPNVVAVHHIVDSPPPAHPWIVMELVRGRSLSDHLAQGPIPPAEAARIGRGILAGLRAAHQVGVLHRDIKPANVLLREDGSPVVTDFGIAALNDATGLTGTGNLVGSLDYVAPERLSGQEGNPASDLWSLGLLMFVAVEGYHPMRRETTVATLAAVLQGTVPVPHRAGPLTPVLQSILVADPHQRPSVEQVDHMLGQVAGGATAPSAPFTPPAPFAGSPASGPATPFPNGPAGYQSVPAAPYPGGPTSPYPGSPSTPYSTGHPPEPIQHANYPGRNSPSTGSKIALAAAALVTVAAVAAAVVALRPTGTDSGPGGGSLPGTILASGTVPATGVRIADATTPNDSTDLLTPAAMRAAVTALEKASGGKDFTEATFYPTFVNAEAPVRDQPKLYDEFVYRNGTATRKGAGGELTDTATITLSSINWDIVPGLFATANEKLGVPKPTLRYVIVNPAWTFNDGRPTLLVYLTDDYGGAYLAANPDGSIVTMYPRGR
ncbi:serine/threonine-protein kinase [Nocardia arizonensis]|uniref:serine/threonine-protein kinase n=1 Tax=Nocardia arizonensis TaxID=1141647 RepID=UPI000A66C62C|nr:serine/threonine-protein kinase [Nocardia arizonensis]